MDKERRKALRAPSQIPVDLYDPKGHAVTAEVQFLNVSESGVMVETPKPLKLKEEVRLRYQPGKEPLFDLKGRVVWVVKYLSAYRYGIRFDARVRNSFLHSSHS